MSDECGNCKFWKRRTDHAKDMGGGYCVRFPPIFQTEPYGSTPALNDGWPMVHQQSWCGEHSPAIPVNKGE